MEWLITILVGFILVIAVAPIAMLMLTLFVLVPLAHLMPSPAMLARTSFDCPVTKRRVNATFVASPESERPADVVACSRFGDGRVTCAKACLEPAKVGWTPSPMVPPYCLLSGDTASR
jgi:hypothetical protein